MIININIVKVCAGYHLLKNCDSNQLCMYFFSTVVCFVPCSVWKEKITYLQFLKWMKPWTKLMKGSGLIGLMEG